MTNAGAPTTNAWRNADRLVDGRLAELLAVWREQEELTFEDIVRRLWADHGVAVSARTISDWCRRLGLDTDHAPTKAST